MTQPPRLLVTRPPQDAARFIAGLEARGQAPTGVIVSPVASFVHANTAPFPGNVAGIVLTSAHALKAPQVRSLTAGLAAFCVGDRTAEAAASLGFDAVSARGDADALVHLVLASDTMGPLVHPHGTHTRGNVAERLTAAGVACTGVEVYRQVARPLSDAAMTALRGDAPMIVPLFSPRSAQIFATQGPFSAPLHIVAMSDAVAMAAAPLNPLSVAVARTPNQRAMIDATLSAFAAIRP